MTNKTIWTVKKGHDFRIRARHPWVFSNELSKSPKGLTVGAPVELQDEKGQFVAFGYGNPNSLIAFRALAFEKVTDQSTQDFLINKILWSWEKRKKLGFKNSFRVCFSENDFLSGLVLDQYAVEQDSKRGLVLVAQVTTAGMEFFIGSDVLSFFKNLHSQALEKKLTDISWENTSIVLRNDTQIRKLEGLEVQEPQIVQQSKNFVLNEIEILMTSPFDQMDIQMTTDLVDGQKTGFFLDQTRNIEVVQSQLYKILKNTNIFKQKPVKILDLCCYVGHWSAQLTHFFHQHKIEVEVTAVDISPKALSVAKKNIERLKPKSFRAIELDVIDKLDTISEKFDIVICDPPALIKNKKAIPTGQHAYMKLNTNAMKLVEKDGLMVTCSCSGLFTKEDFLAAIRKSQQRSQRSAQIISEGGHAPDHPHLTSFPEGFYLKMFLLNLN